MMTWGFNNAVISV